ncbi:MAG: hypothetical protein O2805_10920 [Proteobacteria bacterium]|nr:hypothetical protein [Pseudomonadota bacterium]
MKPGAAGLEDGSSRPQVLRHKLGEDWVELIVTLRRQYRMTAVEIARQLKLRRSTVAAVLHRRGLSKLKLLEPKAPVRRYEHAAAGDMIHIDVKKLARFHQGDRGRGASSHEQEPAGIRTERLPCTKDRDRKKNRNGSQRPEVLGELVRRDRPVEVALRQHFFEYRCP